MANIVKKKLYKNTFMLYLMNIAKLIFPLLTLPYLTRVLTVDCYGIVAYVKACMGYVQILIDFGFMLSATKELVEIEKNTNLKNKILCETTVARLILAVIAFVIIMIFSLNIPMLKDFFLFVILSFMAVILTIFLFDFYFRATEEMHIITIRFVIMKTISTLLTFVLVDSNKDMLWIPVLDILSTIVAVVISLHELKKRDVYYCKIRFGNCIRKIKKSFLYFFSNVTAMSFNALNTIIIGMFLGPIEVAFWCIGMQMVGAVQSFYSPITDGIYPYMIKYKNLKFIKKIIGFGIPIILLGCFIIYNFAEFFIVLVAGNQYYDAANLLRLLIPVLIFSFPVVVLGWPTLGAINKVKETTITTITASFFQMLGIIVLIYANQFNLFNIAVLRCGTEFLLMMMRGGFCLKYKKEFQ